MYIYIERGIYIFLYFSIFRTSETSAPSLHLGRGESMLTDAVPLRSRAEGVCDLTVKEDAKAVDDVDAMADTRRASMVSASVLLHPARGSPTLWGPPGTCYSHLANT